MVKPDYRDRLKLSLALAPFYLIFAYTFYNIARNTFSDEPSRVVESHLEEISEQEIDLASSSPNR